jgi:hypothetical protein
LLNPTLLLLGTFSFDLWFESYLGFTAESLHFREIANRSSFVYLESPPPLFLCARHPTASPAICRAPAAPRRLSSRHVPPLRPRRRFLASRWPAPASPRCATAAQAAMPPAGLPTPAPVQPRLLLDPEHILELPTYSLLYLHTPILLPFLCSNHHTLPEHRRCLGSPLTATHITSHPRSSAEIASPSPTEAHQPTQFRPRAPERPDHSAGELELPLPLGLAVVPSIHSLLGPTKHTISTTSSRGSSLTTSPLLSCPPATRTPTTSLGPPPPVLVRRRYAALVLSSPTPATPETAMSP